MPKLPLTRRFILILAVMGLVGCSPSGIAEQAIRRELPAAIGPADHYDVDIQGLQARSGEAERVVVVGQRVRPEGAPVLDQLTVELLDLQYNRSTRQLERLSGANATARITAADFADFIETQDLIDEANVILLPPDRATIQIRPKLGLVNLALPLGITLDTRGRFVGEDAQIYFVVSEVSAAGAVVGSPVAQILSQAINPIVDLSNLPVDVEVTNISVDNNIVQIDLAGKLN